MTFLLFMSCLPEGAREGGPDEDGGPNLVADSEDDDSEDVLGVAEAEIGADGGTVSLDDFVLDVPEGAFAEDTTLTVTRSDFEAPPWFHASSHLYTIEPADVVPLVPVEVTVPLLDDSATQAYWANGLGGYDPLDAAVADGAAVVLLTQLGAVFAGTLSDGAAWWEPAEVDLLFVVDNSCSMIEEQGKLEAALPGLLTAFDDAELGWRAGVVTTDMDGTGASGSKGRLVETSAGDRWVDAATPNASIEFAWLVAQGTNGSWDEKGRAAAYTALELNAASVNAGFVRDEAQTAILVLSDENDYSAADPINREDFRDWLMGFEDNPEESSFHVIVAPSNPGPCAAETGSDYLWVQAEVGGARHPICNNSYDAMMEAMVAHLFHSAALPIAADPTTHLLSTIGRDGVEAEHPSDAWDVLDTTQETRLHLAFHESTVVWLHEGNAPVDDTDGSDTGP